MTTVGYIGLGQMGGGMALNLFKKTGQLYVYDPFPAAMKPLTDAGAKPLSSAAEMARICDLIFMCLPCDPEVREVIFGADGIASAKPQGLTIVDTTTLDRTDAQKFHAETQAIGIDYWDCPVSGLPFRAHDGTLTIMFGGTDKAFAEVESYLNGFAKTVIHCGPVGCGQAMKAINNIIYDINIAALSEVLPLAVAVGLDPEQLAELTTTGSSRSFASEHFVPRMITRQFHSDFTMQGAYKDITNVERMAAETGARTPLVDAMVGSYQAAIDAGYGAEPKSAMLKVYEQALGVVFRKSGGAD